MASDDKSTEPTAISDDNDAADETSSCLNDPNYAIICVFLQKFGSHLKIEHPDFMRLQKMIENTDEGKAIIYTVYNIQQQQQQKPYKQISQIYGLMFECNAIGKRFMFE